MVNLLKIVWISSFEHSSGIKENLRVGDYFCDGDYILCGGFIRDCFYLCKGIYD